MKLNEFLKCPKCGEIGREVGQYLSNIHDENIHSLFREEFKNGSMVNHHDSLILNCKCDNCSTNFSSLIFLRNIEVDRVITTNPDVFNTSNKAAQAMYLERLRKSMLCDNGIAYDYHNIQEESKNGDQNN